MQNITNSTFFSTLDQIALNINDCNLADVFRFVSFEPGEKYHEHMHLRIEINYVKKGSCIMHIDNESIILKENELIIICSNIQHSFESGTKGCTLMQLEFLPDVFLRFVENDCKVGDNNFPFNVFSTDNRFIKLVNNVRIMRIVERILVEMNSKTKYYKHLIVMYYMELIMLIHRHMDEDYLPICANETLRSAISFIRLNYQKELTIEEVASNAGVGERYLRKLFAKYINMSPLDYLNQVRINKSIELLRITDLSIKEICFKCGFKSPQYFSRVFKQSVGVSPHEISLN